MPIDSSIEISLVQQVVVVGIRGVLGVLEVLLLGILLIGVLGYPVPYYERY